MKAQFDQNILSSFYLWFENQLLSDSAKAYKVDLSNAFISGSFSDIPPSHIAFQGKYRSLVGEHQVWRCDWRYGTNSKFHSQGS